ncbi:MAG: NAD(P)-dependent oxidoreductase [Proteobacteria bacterium]|nr:NAD(P)-dependent oxidoreductase [Pseudomonadota bacterium]
MKAIGVIGLGIMGASYARNLIKNGFEVYGFDVDPARMAMLSDEGIHPCENVAHLATKASELITSLPTPQALHEVVRELCGLGTRLTELVVADTCTLTLEDKLLAKSKLEVSGGCLLDCPVSGTGAQAAKADLTIFASGDDVGVNRMKPAFAAIGRTTHELGVFGNGSKMKYVANLLVAIHNVSAAEAFAFAQKAGIHPEAVYKVLHGSAGSSRIFEVRGPMMVTGDYLTGLSATHRLMHKDISIISAYIQELAVQTPLFNEAAKIHDEAIAQGFEMQDTASVCAVMERKNGIDRAGG